MKTRLKFFLAGFANGLIFLLGYLLGLCYLRMIMTRSSYTAFHSELIVCLTLLYYLGMFFLCLRFLCRLLSISGPPYYLGSAILGGFVSLLGAGGIIWLMSPVLTEWAIPGIRMNPDWWYYDYRLRDDWTEIILLMVMLSFLLPLITCLTAWIVQRVKSRKLYGNRG